MYTHTCRRSPSKHEFIITNVCAEIKQDLREQPAVTTDRVRERESYVYLHCVLKQGRVVGLGGREEGGVG